MHCQSASDCLLHRRLLSHMLTRNIYIAGGGVVQIVMPYIVFGLQKHHYTFIAWRLAFYVPASMHIIIALAIIILGQVCFAAYRWLAQLHISSVACGFEGVGSGHVGRVLSDCLMLKLLQSWSTSYVRPCQIRRRPSHLLLPYAVGTGCSPPVQDADRFD